MRCSIFGVTTLDVVRASRFLGEIKNADPKDIEVTVVGGHSGVTIVPLLSQTKLGKDVSGEQYKALVKRIQFGGDEVVQAKAGTGSATLSMAYAGARFANSVIRAMNGESGVVEPTFVKSPLYKDQGVEYFSSNVELGPEGVKNIHPVGSLSAEEEELLKACLPEYAHPSLSSCSANLTGSRRTSRRARSSSTRPRRLIYSTACMHMIADEIRPFIDYCASAELLANFVRI